MRYVYSFLLLFLLPFVFFKLWWRGRPQPGYRLRWKERVGYIQATKSVKHLQNKPKLWLHTVSVGEFIAAKPLIDYFLKKNTYQLVITCTTPSGSDQIQKKYGDKVFHVYAPYDIGFFVRNFIKVIEPKAYLIMETELWPNTIHYCMKKQIPSVLVNARMSEKSARNYKKFAQFSAQLLSNIDLVIAQHKSDANRFISLGTDSQKCVVSGSIKFDLSISESYSKAQEIKSWINAKKTLPTLIAASTHRGEDEKIISAFQTLLKNGTHARLILVPRHIDRFQEVYNLCKKSNLKTIKRSENLDANLNPGRDFDILLGDTMGELLALLGASDIAFIGGSFIENGGHNYIEAAAWELPILAGPSRFNFQNISDELIENKGLTLVHNETELTQQWQLLIENFELRIKQGQAAKVVADKNRGVLSKTIQAIENTI